MNQNLLNCSADFCKKKKMISSRQQVPLKCYDCLYGTIWIESFKAKLMYLIVETSIFSIHSIYKGSEEW